MESVLSKEIQAGLDKARADAARKSSRLRVDIGDKQVPVLRMWKTGFATELGGSSLRGFVDLYDGSIHMFQCLIVAAEEAPGEMLYEYKRATAVADKAALDFELPEGAPVALITDANR
ncbi:hypothetical protein [uncultured Roseobacter sp.]|uniref:hypothetical protein n=1 Tax=uncultured Roseobacter sp. TaxID=114847 RepID=UPI00261032C6|nr:hypothetical protein [uncultured Roseobacter sp.]